MNDVEAGKASEKHARRDIYESRSKASAVTAVAEPNPSDNVLAPPRVRLLTGTSCLSQFSLMSNVDICSVQAGEYVV